MLTMLNLSYTPFKEHVMRNAFLILYKKKIFGLKHVLDKNTTFILLLYNFDHIYKRKWKGGTVWQDQEMTWT